MIEKQKSHQAVIKAKKAVFASSDDDVEAISQANINLFERKIVKMQMREAKDFEALSKIVPSRNKKEKYEKFDSK